MHYAQNYQSAALIILCFALSYKVWYLVLHKGRYAFTTCARHAAKTPIIIRTASFKNMKQEWEKIAERLQKEKTEIEEELSNLKTTLDFGDETDHLEEESDESEEIGNYLGIKKLQDARLEQINRALGKIKDGSYGKCEKCGMAIEQKILDIDPESLLCKACKLKEKN